MTQPERDGAGDNSLAARADQEVPDGAEGQCQRGHLTILDTHPQLVKVREHHQKHDGSRFP